MSNKVTREVSKSYIRGRVVVSRDHIGSLKHVDAMIDEIFDHFEKALTEKDEQLAEQQHIAFRTLSIGENEGWWETDDEGFWNASLHKDLTKMAEGKELKNIVRAKNLYIEHLQTENKQLQEMVDIAHRALRDVYESGVPLQEHENTVRSALGLDVTEQPNQGGEHV